MTGTVHSNLLPFPRFGITLRHGGCCAMYLRYVAQFDNLQIHLYTMCEHVCLLVRPGVCLSVCLSVYLNTLVCLSSLTYVSYF